MKRVLTALVLVPLVTGVVFMAPPVVVVGGLALTALLCLREFFDIVGTSDVRPFRIIGYVVTTVLVTTSDLLEAEFFTGVVALLLILWLGLRRSMAGKSMGATFLGMVYVGGPFALARELHLFNPHWLFWVLFLNWIGDSAAYYAGRAFGHHKLAPRVSPNKTWEGSVASTVMSTVVGVTYWVYFALEPAINIYAVILVAVLVNIAGQVGDLAESLLKRRVGLKDSGDMLPGHGGILDRVDGVLFSVPVLYWLLNSVPIFL